MHCDQCGKENRSGSRFCRSCGSDLLELSRQVTAKYSFKLTWRSPIVLTIVILIFLGGLVYGGSKGYAYYLVESKINSAKELQSTGNYKESINTLLQLENKKISESQKSRIDTIRSDGLKFISFKTSFDNAVAIQNATSTATTTSSGSLKKALSELQSIDSSYPEYENVQAEIKKVQDSLVLVLEGEVNTSKREAVVAAAQAEKNKAAAAAAQAAKVRAEQNAQQAAIDAQSKASAARSLEVAKSFVSQLTTIYNNLTSNGLGNALKGITDWNDGEYNSANLYLGAAISACSTAQSDALELNDRFTGMPSTYVNAADDLYYAANYLCKSMEYYLKDYNSSAQSSLEYYKIYNDRVKSFLLSV